MGEKGFHLRQRLYFEKPILGQWSYRKKLCWSRIMFHEPCLVNLDSSYCIAAWQATKYFACVTFVGYSAQLLALPCLSFFMWPPVYFLNFEYERIFHASASKINRLPSLHLCDLPIFLVSLESSLADILSPEEIHWLSSSKNINNVIVSQNLNKWNQIFKICRG